MIWGWWFVEDAWRIGGSTSGMAGLATGSGVGKINAINRLRGPLVALGQVGSYGMIHPGTPF